MVDAPSVIQSANEGFFEIITGLCRNFAGLSPFEILNSDLKDVYDLYVDTAIANYKKNKKSDGAVWVTSKTASWH